MRRCDHLRTPLSSRRGSVNGTSTVPERRRGKAAEMIRVLLIDRNERARRALRAALATERDVTVLADTPSLAEAKPWLPEAQPDVVVVDLPRALHEWRGIIRELRRRAPAAQVLALTLEDGVFARSALGEGAAGCVAKEHADSELPVAIRATSRGETYLSPRLRVPASGSRDLARS